MKVSMTIPGTGALPSLFHFTMSPTFIQNLKEIFPLGVRIVVNVALSVKVKNLNPATIVGTINNETFAGHIEDLSCVIELDNAELYQVTYFHHVSETRSISR
jgi:hypothetical protein